MASPAYLTALDDLENWRNYINKLALPQWAKNSISTKITQSQNWLRGISSWSYTRLPELGKVYQVQAAVMKTAEAGTDATNKAVEIAKFKGLSQITVRKVQERDAANKPPPQPQITQPTIPPIDSGDFNIDFVDAFNEVSPVTAAKTNILGIKDNIVDKVSSSIETAQSAYTDIQSIGKNIKKAKKASKNIIPYFIAGGGAVIGMGIFYFLKVRKK